jgi:hypothetical protein
VVRWSCSEKGGVWRAVLESFTTLLQNPTVAVRPAKADIHVACRQAAACGVITLINAKRLLLLGSGTISASKRCSLILLFQRYFWQFYFPANADKNSVLRHEIDSRTCPANLQTRNDRTAKIRRCRRKRGSSVEAE